MAFFKNLFGKNNNNNNQQTRPAGPAPKSEVKLSNKLALGAGCYWGTEKYVRKNFQKQFPGSVKSATVGFMSPETVKGAMSNPSYEDVCTGRSGHVEVLLVELNEPEKHFEELVRFFFQFHDPTTQNRQGNDVGFQYASFVFCGDEAQLAIAQRVRDEVQSLLSAGALSEAGYARKKVTTLVAPLTEFTAAHEAHQKYLEKNPNGYCNHRMRFKMWPALVVAAEEQEDDKNNKISNQQEEEAQEASATGTTN